MSLKCDINNLYTKPSSIVEQIIGIFLIHFKSKSVTVQNIPTVNPC